MKKSTMIVSVKVDFYHLESEDAEETAQEISSEMDYSMTYKDSKTFISETKIVDVRLQKDNEEE